MFPDRILIKNPLIVYRKEVPPSDFTFVSETKHGEFYLVVPARAKEVLFIQLLGKNVDRFVPAEGEGVLIKRSAIEFL
jgi:hypothetical protein